MELRRKSHLTRRIREKSPPTVQIGYGPGYNGITEVVYRIPETKPPPKPKIIRPEISDITDVGYHTPTPTIPNKRPPPFRIR